MKKLIIVAVSCLLTSNVFAYTVKIRNSTAGQLKGTLFQASGPKKNFSVEQGETKKIGTGLYCIEYVTVEPTSGTAERKQYSYIPPLTGYGIACKSFEANVMQLADNTLSFQGPVSQSGYTVNIYNQTDGQAVVAFKFGAKGICNEPEYILEAGGTKKIRTGTCCTTIVKVRSTSGSSMKYEYTFTPPRTGIKESCRGYDLFIRKLADGTLSLATD